MTDVPAPSDRPIDALWAQVATALRADVGPAAWRNGLASLVGVALQDDAMVVGAPSRFHLDFIQGRHRDAIERAIHSVLGPDIGLELVVSDRPGAIEPNPSLECVPESGHGMPAVGDRESSFDRHFDSSAG